MQAKKLLIITSEPLDQPRVDVEDEVQTIKNLAKEWNLKSKFENSKYTINVEHRGRVTDAELSDIFRDQSVDILHFVGHGSPDGIVVRDRRGESEVSDFSYLESVLGNCKPRFSLVFFNTCFSRDLAELFKKYAQYTIGCKDKTDDNIAKSVAEHFYDFLFQKWEYESSYNFALTQTKYLSKDSEANILQFLTNNYQLFDPKAPSKQSSSQRQHSLSLDANSQHLKDMGRCIDRDKQLLIPFFGPEINLFYRDKNTTRLIFEQHLTDYLLEQEGKDLLRSIVGDCPFCRGTSTSLPKDCPLMKAWLGRKADSDLIVSEQDLSIARLKVRYLAQHKKLNNNRIIDIYTDIRSWYNNNRARLEPSPMYTLFAEFIRDFQKIRNKSPLPLIVTTNYDDLLESSLYKAGVNFDIVYYSVPEEEGLGGSFWHQPGKQNSSGNSSAPKQVSNTYEVLAEDKTVILKLCGTLAAENFAIAEDHYINYPSYKDINTRLLPGDLLNSLQRRHTVLMLGCSVNDSQHQMILKSIWGPKRIGGRGESWLIHHDQVCRLDQLNWQKRHGVSILEYDLSTYYTELYNIFNQILTKIEDSRQNAETTVAPFESNYA
jgi:hypothetical protein